MSEEEFINRIINQISKDYGGVMANELKYIIIRKDKEIERLNNIIDEIESIVYADMSNIDVRISIQEKLDKLKELKGE